MPENAAAYAERIRQHLDAERRLSMPEGGIPFWEVFPFEQEGLRLKALSEPLDSEPPRHGEDPATCRCADPSEPTDDIVWQDDGWRLHVAAPTGAPLVLILMPKAHHDLATLPPDLASELGRLTVAVAAAVEALPSVARCHVSRWGDGGAHLHLFFIARPALMGQLRGTCMALWDDFLPPVPLEVRDTNVSFVVDRLLGSVGGTRG